ncbi:hypothetical protein TrCOL_g10774, partial [Triparma columacea]
MSSAISQRKADLPRFNNARVKWENSKSRRKTKPDGVLGPPVSRTPLYKPHDWPPKGKVWVESPTKALPRPPQVGKGDAKAEGTSVIEVSAPVSASKNGGGFSFGVKKDLKEAPPAASSMFGFGANAATPPAKSASTSFGFGAVKPTAQSRIFGSGSSSTFGTSATNSAAVSMPTPNPTPTSTSFKRRLSEFYKKHNPSKLSTVDATLEKYKGKEEEMFAKLKLKYEPAPAKSKSTFPERPTHSDQYVCYFDISIGGVSVGRIVFGLYSETPLATENFHKLCSGELGRSPTNGARLCYEGCKFHRVVKGFVAQGGDFTKGNGTGGISIYGGTPKGDMWGKFNDDKTFYRHDKKGLLSMANSGKNTNSSQFFITLKATPHLDGKHIVFGEVLSGYDVVENIERVKVEGGGKPCGENSVVIEKCGLGEGEKKKEDYLPTPGKSVTAKILAGGMTPAINFGSPTTTKDSFSFGTPKTSAPAPAFGSGLSFGAPAPAPAPAPTPTPATGGFTFGAPAASTPTPAPAAFGGGFTFGAPAPAPAAAPAPAPAAAASSASLPTPTNPNEAKALTAWVAVVGKTADTCDSDKFTALV